uniref:Uncharacterized protein n=1 Tax=Heterorhabditis bacteriophora TaxID=37862 RepID=A0A1I7WP84_HETBA
MEIFATILKWDQLDCKSKTNPNSIIETNIFSYLKNFLREDAQKYNRHIATHFQHFTPYLEILNFNKLSKLFLF